MSRSARDTVVLLPTYNERRTLCALTEQILALTTADICVIDDNSPDGTGRLACELAARESRIHVLQRPKKDGLGKAYQEGFRFALERDYQRIVQMDADFSHQPSALPHLIHLTERHDIAIGSRWVPGGATQGWPWTRQLLSQLGSAYARILLTIPVRDVTSGFKCIRRHVLEALSVQSLQSSGYVFQIEFTHRALEAGFSVVETPITFSERESGDSKMSKRILLEAAVRVPLLRLQGAAP